MIKFDYFYLIYFHFLININSILYFLLFFYGDGDWGLGIGDWGLGIGLASLIGSSSEKTTLKPLLMPTFLKRFLSI